MQYNVLKGRIILISYNRGCEMRSKCLKILLLSSAIILSGCNNNNTENDSARDFLNATQKETVISAKEYGMAKLSIDIRMNRWLQ